MQRAASEHSIGRELPVSRSLMVVAGAKIVQQHYYHYGRELAKYNRRLKLLGSPLVVRQRHSSGGKIYHGRYFYQRYYDEDDDLMRQKYIGTEVPIDHVPIGGFPQAPENPLEGLECQIIEGNVILSEAMYERFISIFSDHLIIPIMWG